MNLKKENYPLYTSNLNIERAFILKE